MEQMPDIDYQRLIEPELKEVQAMDTFAAFGLRSVEEGGMNVIKSWVQGVPKKFRQWFTDGKELNYYDSVIGSKQGTNRVVSDNGYRTGTTIVIINAVLQVIARGTKLDQEKGVWVLRYGDKTYAWGGDLVIPEDFEGDGVPRSTHGELPLLSGGAGDLLKQRKDFFKTLDADVEAVWNMFVSEGGGSGTDISAILEKYEIEEASTPFDLFYLYYQAKGYSRPEANAEMSVRLPEKSNVLGIESMDIKGNTVLLEWEEKGRYGNEIRKDNIPVAEIGDKTSDQVIEYLSQKKPKDDHGFKRMVKEAIRYFGKKALMKKETGTEYEHIHGR